jgi:hypothetical protein
MTERTWLTRLSAMEPRLRLSLARFKNGSLSAAPTEM